MEQYISKSALVAEIEKLKLCTMDEHMNFYSEAAEGEYHALSNLESFIDTLEVKEVDLDDEKDAYICNHFSEGSDGGMISDAHREIGGVTYFDLSNITEHFFELGLKAQKGE